MPHTSQPGGACRAKSSTRGRSPISRTIRSRVSSGFLLCSSRGATINWETSAALRFGFPLVASRHTEKPAGRFWILFDPAKCHRLISKTPCPDYVKDLIQNRECHPQKQGAVRCGQLPHRQSAYLWGCHQRVVPSCSAVPSTAIMPRRIGINDIELLICYVTFLLNAPGLGRG